MMMVIFIIILSFFFYFIFISLPSFSSPFSPRLAGIAVSPPWPLHGFGGDPGGGGVGSSARSSWSHGELLLLCCPPCALWLGPIGLGRGDRGLPRWLWCSGVGGRGARRLKRFLSLVDGAELPPSSPGIGSLQAPLGALVSSWLSHFPGDWVFLKLLVCFCWR